MNPLDSDTAGRTAAPPAVEIINLSRRFGDVQALDRIDLTIQQGELVSLLGASGSGKSTLLRQIAGFDVPTSGNILLHGQDVTRLSPAQRDIGMVFQNYALFPHMSVRRNIEYGLRMRGWEKTRRADRVTEMLDRMRLSALGDRLPTELSGGQQQRVAIARALAFSPRLLLMDEPLGALDKALKEDLLEEIRRVHREFGTTIIYVTHDREEALVLSDRIALMDAGRVQVCAPVKSLYLQPPTRFAAQFISGSCVLRFDQHETLRLIGQQEIGGRVEVEIGGERVHLDPPTAITGDLELAIRPSGFSVEASGTQGTLPGRVIESVFLGDQIRLAVELEHFDLQTKVMLGLADGAAVHEGDLVGLRPVPGSLSVVSA